MALPSVKLTRAMLYPFEQISVETVAGFLSLKGFERTGRDISNSFLEFLSDTALLAKQTVDCKVLLRFFDAKDISTISTFELLQKEDFFVHNKNDNLTNSLIDYHSKYGVPVWTVWTKDSFFISETECPAEWNISSFRGTISEFIRKSFTLSPDKENDTIDILSELAEKNAYPLAFSIPFLIDFYHHFITEDAEAPIVLGTRTPHGIYIKTNFSLLKDRSRVISLEAYELENVAYAAAIILMMDNGGLRFCKCCAKMFVADRPRAEYCSPRCRNVYNTRMSRLRQKSNRNRSSE